MEKFFKTLADNKKIPKTSYTKLHEKHLGRGALGEVYEGTLRITNKKPLVSIKVALKEMVQVSSYQDHEVELIKREHEILCKVQGEKHENIIKFFGVSEVKSSNEEFGGLVLILELAESLF